jgi:LacI family transcriptional regulator
MRYGPRQRRLLYCKTCKARFSERKGTPLFDTRLPEDKAVSVLAHIAEGCGVRKTGRLVGVNKDTVVRYSLLAGQHAKQLHDELVAVSPPDPRSPVRREVGLRRQEGKEL